MSSIYSDYDTMESEESEAEREEKQAKIDFKMVTFSLADRAYGLDIMCVKEISKADRFTMVPNTPFYVEGVYNLRGEIIPIINMRRMFHLEEVERKKGELANILILRIEESIIGVIVDRIENVIGLDSSTIQPRHPLFTDINMKYIHGIVETGDKLYVILDADRIFGDEQGLAEIRQSGQQEHADKETTGGKATEKKEAAVGKKKADNIDQDFLFIKDTLATFAQFYVDETNQAWVEHRLPEWKSMRKAGKENVQLMNPEDALLFLKPFYSACTGRLWDEAQRDGFLSLLSSMKRNSFKVWNPGTGKGSEAFSIAAILRVAYPDARIKVWACDMDLLAISAAPSMSWNKADIPQYMSSSGFMAEATGGGYQFVPALKDLLYFEYHDVRHGSALPDLDIIVARDIISFYDAAEKARLLEYFSDRLSAGGLLVLGDNETVHARGWRRIEGKKIAGYLNEKS
ncbi:MAG: chemotaxis protein CheR [Spirochaetaceae bacterium]|nr:MAG: chemotaxis protein CheR [Spirochaetaceae bacterium]